MPTDVDPHETTVQQAREIVRSRRDDGIHCPCCDRYVKVYRRSITRSQVLFLAHLYRLARQEANLAGVAPEVIRVDARDIKGQHMRGGDYAKLTLWGLVDSPADTPGLWRINPKGVAWLYGDVSVDRYAHVVDGELLRYSGPRWSVHDAYRETFRIQDIF